MPINFVDENLETIIYCDKVCLDGHEVTNLITPNPALSRAGFIVESFVKPPVNVTIAFAINVDLSEIVIDCKVGCQRITSVEVYTACLGQQRHSPVEKSQLGDALFAFVGRGRCSETDNYRLKFYNARYIERSSIKVNPAFSKRENNPRQNPHSGEKDSKSESDDCSNRFVIRHHLAQHISAVSAVCLRITGTCNGSAVALRSVVVRGQPSAGMHKQFEQLVEKRASTLSIHQPVCDRDGLLSCENSRSRGSTNNYSPDNVTLAQDEFLVPTGRNVDTSVFETRDVRRRAGEAGSLDIPEDFQDALTREVMTCPMLLPSGQVIDRTTLDRFSEQEALWGRAPSDPFTGIPLAGTNKPVVSVSLKARIDQFLLIHGDVVWQRSGYRSYVLGQSGRNGRQSVEAEQTENSVVTGQSCESVSVSESKSRTCIQSEGRVYKRPRLTVDSMNSSVIASIALSQEPSIALSQEISIALSQKSYNRNTPTISDEVRKGLQSSCTGEKSSADISGKWVACDKNKSYSISTRTVSSCLYTTSDNDISKFNQKINNEIVCIREKPDKLLDTDDDCVIIDNPGRSEDYGQVTRHETKISSSLDESLQSTLSFLPSFTRKAAQNKGGSPNESRPKCSQCSSAPGELLYALACSHYACRNCLVAASHKQSAAVCKVCGTSVACHLAARVHVNTAG